MNRGLSANDGCLAETARVTFIRAASNLSERRESAFGVRRPSPSLRIN